MPPLANPRHERFVRALFEGKSADEAYVKAGYSENRGNASRLKANENILARLTELQAAAAKKSKVTVESLLDELEHARQRADGLDQLSAAVKAISEKAKISGLLVQKVEVGGAGAFENCGDSTEDVVRAMCEEYAKDGYQFTEQEFEELHRRMLACWHDIHDYIASCKAKPLNGRNVESAERKRLGLAPRQIGSR